MKKKNQQTLTLKIFKGKKKLSTVNFPPSMLRLTKRVENIETISGSIKKKIDIVLDQLESMEEDSSKKKDHMSKLMDEFVEGKEFDFDSV